MPFCGTCGAQVEGRFCARCGSSVGAAAPAGPAGSTAPPPPTYQPVAVGAGTPMADNVASGLCYAPGLITGILFLVIAPYNQNKVVRFNAFQSLFLAGTATIYWILTFMLSIGLAMISFMSLARLALSMIELVIWLGFFLVWLYTIISTFQGKTVELPIIGRLARQQA
jgi:uncharacterized membrane protein